MFHFGKIKKFKLGDLLVVMIGGGSQINIFIFSLILPLVRLNK